MGVVGKVRFKHPGGIKSVDIVDLGDSYTGRSLRIRTTKGTKEFNAVPLDDSRASAVRVKTPSGIQSLAADGRNTISHSSSATLEASRNTAGQITAREIHLGRTQFNKTIKLELSVQMHLTVDCGYNASLTSGFDSGDTRCRIKAVSVATGTQYLSNEVTISGSRRHDALAYFPDIVIDANREVTLSGLPPGTYNIYMLMNGYRSPSSGHLSSTGEYARHRVRCTEWREYVR